MKRLGIVVLLVLLALAPAGPSASAQTTTLNALFMKQAAYSDADVQAMTAEFEKSHPGVKINLEFVPYEALHDKIVASVAAGARGYDVVLFDVIWPAEFSENGVLLDITNRISKDVINAVWAGAWTTVMYKDRYYGLPWILDTKYLFYNKEMMGKAGFTAPPKTWDELLRQARAIKAKGVVQYPIVWSWAQAEAIVCDYTTLLAAFGGSFFEKGSPRFNTGGGLQALQYMVDSLGQGLSNPASRESLEEDVRRIFSAGQAAFALNWTYMYNLANDPKESKVAGKVGVVPAPGDGVHSTASAVNGSMALGVMRTSKNLEMAFQYAQYLTSRPVQERYAKLSLPIWKASYTSPAVMKGQETLIAAAKLALPAMYPRPLLVRYQEFSTILQTNLQKALLKQLAPKAALDAVANEAVQKQLK